jgi:hypothetical protein
MAFYSCARRAMIDVGMRTKRFSRSIITPQLGVFANWQAGANT